MKSTLIPLIELVDIDRQVQRIRNSSDTILYFDTYPTQNLVFPLQAFTDGGYKKYIITMTADNYSISEPAVIANHVWHIVADEYLPPGWSTWGIAANNKASVGAAIDKSSSSVTVPVNQNATTGEIAWGSINDPENWYGGVWDEQSSTITGGIGTIISNGVSTYMVTEILCIFRTYTTWLKRVGDTVSEIPRFGFESPDIVLQGDKCVYDNLTGKWIGGTWAYDEVPKLLADYTFGQVNAIQSDSNGQYSKIRNVRALYGWFWPTGNHEISLNEGAYEGQLLDGMQWGNVKKYKIYRVYGKLITPEFWGLPPSLKGVGVLPQVFVGGVLLGSMRGKANMRINTVVPAMTLLRILKGGNEWQQPE